MADRDPDVPASERDVPPPGSDGAPEAASRRDGAGHRRDPVTPETRDRAEARRERPDDSAGSFLRELPVLLLIAFVLAFLLRTFVSRCSTSRRRRWSRR